MEEILDDIIENMTLEEHKELVNKLIEKSKEDKVLESYYVLVKIEKER